jgi:hypothetical protein
MKTVLAASTIAILTFSVPAFSQTSGAGPDAGGIPESMRIQQQVDRQNSANPQSLITKPGATTTDAPGAAPPPVEQNRLDPSAPSRQRLQIDEGASARAIQNPGATTTNPNAAGNFNTIIEARAVPRLQAYHRPFRAASQGHPEPELQVGLVEHLRVADLQAVVLPAAADASVAPWTY